MCNCFKDNLERIKEHVSKKLTDFEKSYLHVEWQDYAYMITEKDYVPVNPKVNIEYRTKKRSGDIAKSKKKDSVSMMARYCPFCGRDTKKEKDND